MDRSYLERNAAGLARFRALLERLSDDDLMRPVEGDWTVGALLAHLAFWDRIVVVRFGQAARDGQRVPPSLEDRMADLINAAALEEWRALPPRTVVRQTLAAAEAVERLIATLGEEVVAEAIAGERRGLVERTLHWGGHLDQIETSLGRQA